MSWSITKTKRGWEWSCANSAYGAAVGIAPTEAQAKVELYLAEAEMFEAPLPPTVAWMMLADPERFAADLGGNP